jgi:hypothetical protein
MKKVRGTKKHKIGAAAAKKVSRVIETNDIENNAELITISYFFVFVFLLQ